MLTVISREPIYPLTLYQGRTVVTLSMSITFCWFALMTIRSVRAFSNLYYYSWYLHSYCSVVLGIIQNERKNIVPFSIMHSIHAHCIPFLHARHTCAPCMAFIKRSLGTFQKSPNLHSWFFFWIFFFFFQLVVSFPIYRLPFLPAFFLYSFLTLLFPWSYVQRHAFSRSWTQVAVVVVLCLQL